VFQGHRFKVKVKVTETEKQTRLVTQSPNNRTLYYTLYYEILTFMRNFAISPLPDKNTVNWNSKLCFFVFQQLFKEH